MTVLQLQLLCRASALNFRGAPGTFHCGSQIQAPPPPPPAAMPHHSPEDHISLDGSEEVEAGGRKGSQKSTVTQERDDET